MQKIWLACISSIWPRHSQTVLSHRRLGRRRRWRQPRRGRSGCCGGWRGMAEGNAGHCHLQRWLRRLKILQYNIVATWKQILHPWDLSFFFGSTSAQSWLNTYSIRDPNPPHLHLLHGALRPGSYRGASQQGVDILSALPDLAGWSGNLHLDSWQEMTNWPSIVSMIASKASHVQCKKTLVV